MNELIPREATVSADAVAPHAPAEPTAPAPRRNRRIGPWLIGIVTTALIGTALAGGWWYWQSGGAVQYATAVVGTGPVVRAVSATGTVNPELTIIVGSYVSGVIQELHCDYNTRVKRGQVCARIDARPYQTAVDQARANLAVAKAQLEKDKAQLNYARLAYERAAALIRTNAISKDAFDNAQNAHDQALAQILFDEATIQQRQAALDAALVNLDYTQIVSPVDGTVVSRNVTVGQTVAASFQTPTLFLIATDLTRMQVDANVSESDIGNIREGNRATFTVDAYPRRTFTGVVTQVRQSPQTVQNVVTYDVVIGVNNDDLALKPGLTAATRIITAERDQVLRVPNQALRYVPGGRPSGDQTRVWVLREGRLVPVRVIAGLDDEDYTEILGGDVKAGDRVILSEQRDGSGARRPTPRPRL